MAKKPRPRRVRRAAERAGSKLAQARERLFGLELGGTPDRPLTVQSAAVVEAHASSVVCPRCEGKHDVVEHIAIKRGDTRLREARLRCRQCASERSVWFLIRDVGPN
jgi:hypothetical protein